MYACSSCCRVAPFAALLSDTGHPVWIAILFSSSLRCSACLRLLIAVVRQTRISTRSICVRRKDVVCLPSIYHYMTSVYRYMVSVYRYMVIFYRYMDSDCRYMAIHLSCDDFLKP